MKKIICFWVLYVLGFSYHLSAQPISIQRRERMKIVKRISRTRNPYIRLNDNTKISVEEFLNMSDSIQWLRSYKSGSERAALWGEKGVNGVIDLRTVQYNDSLEMLCRINSIRDYRRNEMNCFFGNKQPLILFGDREISRKDFCELPEDTVAFINFFLTDFVKEYYAPKGSWGIVYVCPRNTRSQIKYIPSMDLPANGRNYIDDFYKKMFPYFTGGDEYSHMSYIHEIMKGYKEKIGKKINATVYISCVVRPNGTIDPILVEDIQTQQELTDVQLETIISISEDIIRTMPRWEMPGRGIVYDKKNNVYYEDIREYSISIPIGFGDK